MIGIFFHKERLQNVHPKLVKVLALAEKRWSTSEVCITCGFRTTQDQDKAFAEGHSNAKAGQSPHNYKPALAVDIAMQHEGKLDYVNLYLYDQLLDIIEEAGHELGIPVETRLHIHTKHGSYIDYPHIQLKDWKTMKDAPKVPAVATPPSKVG